MARKQAPPAPGVGRGRQRTPLLWAVLGALPPLFLDAVGSASALRGSADVYDAGVALTLARFSNLTILPYRDLWTLYGPGLPYFGHLAFVIGGPTVTALKLEQLLVHAAMIVGLYLLLRRFLPWWFASVLSAVPATLTPVITHYAHALVFVVWGLWFILRSEDDGKRSTRRLATGACLLGFSFLGRYEFAAVAIGSVILLWWYLRPRLGRSASRSILALGLAPPLLFLVYVFAVVGVERAWLNLVEYPIRFYPLPYCRGIGTPWGAALGGLFAPFQGRWWTAFDVMLGGATYIAPLAGVLSVTVGVRRWRGRGIRGSVALLAGLLTLFLWTSMRARSGTSPQAVWPMLLLAVGATLEAARRHLPRLITGAALTLIVIVAGTIVTSWWPGARSSLSGWPSPDPRFGVSAPPEGLYDRLTWTQVERTVHRFASEGEPIYVTLTRNSGTYANAPMFYWYVDRPPASRFIEYSPCLTDTDRVQRQIVDDLAETRVVIATTFFQSFPPPFPRRATVLDDYLADHFRAVLDLGLPADPEEYRVQVLVRVEATTPGERP